MLMIVIVAIAGAVFIYGAVKGTDPREIVKNALRGK